LTSKGRAAQGSHNLGNLMLICGFLAITLPLASGIGVAIVVGWLVLISGVWHLIFAFRSHGIGGVLWQLLLALIYGAAGIMILLYPLACVAWLALVLATSLFLEAGVEFSLYVYLLRT